MNLVKIVYSQVCPPSYYTFRNFLRFSQLCEFMYSWAFFQKNAARKNKGNNVRDGIFAENSGLFLPKLTARRASLQMHLPADFTL